MRKLEWKIDIKFSERHQSDIIFNYFGGFQWIVRRKNKYGEKAETGFLGLRWTEPHLVPDDEVIGQIKPVFMRVCGTSIQILQQNCNKFTMHNA